MINKPVPETLAGLNAENVVSVQINMFMLNGDVKSVCFLNSDNLADDFNIALMKVLSDKK